MHKISLIPILFTGVLLAREEISNGGKWQRCAIVLFGVEEERHSEQGRWRKRDKGNDGGMAGGGGSAIAICSFRIKAGGEVLWAKKGYEVPPKISIFAWMESHKAVLIADGLRKSWKSVIERVGGCGDDTVSDYVGDRVKYVGPSVHIEADNRIILGKIPTSDGPTNAYTIIHGRWVGKL
ncbi:P-loop containing nucleoside triphosphate hydrolases superfamily protein [Actinidia rufa]|uniref:P-loop containing nucleoside triphosphate hydrolases superfamily protein n=1 Tax=Actinidia rufa TaxID=165716 RepID=A0A7J0GY68_9ERIC|nr:P-loop containing nucleoside triphosphate hydrolases superfamily protein [Actinidia rufa]